jgi:tetratricopeptide (TPR) repeat protein
VYRDALLALCELTYHEGRYGDAIGRLQDFLTLYPDDAETSRARFTLADAHRRSAYALRDDSVNTATAAEGKQRFQQAAELYQALLRDLDAAGESDPVRALYARLALFYQADCLFELNEPETLAAALAAYRSAAARYDGQPAALTAQVQIANVSLRLGQLSDAARALERARWLLRSIPAAAFTACNGGDRATWERFLTVVSSSDLFQAMFASATWPTPASAEER